MDTLLEYSGVPVLIQPNAGLPKLEDGQTVYDISIDDYVACMKGFAERGVRLFGGCCGTTPEYIAALRKAVDAAEIPPLPVRKRDCGLFGTQAVILDGKASVIGERINPTGKKVLKEKLRAQDFGLCGRGGAAAGTGWGGIFWMSTAACRRLTRLQC